MSKNLNFRLPLAFALALSLAACSTGKHQNPVASNEEQGKVTEDAQAAEKPPTYTALAGDTLRKIAKRPEIYGDPNLWPVLQEANADVLGQSMSVNKGVVLKIPRDLTPEQIDMAHEKARQAAAASKMSSATHKRSMPVKAEAVPSPVPQAQAPAQPAPTPVPPQPVPQAKKGGILLPVLLVILLILAALAAILFYFMKKDAKEDGQG
jgi:LysM repeat protein